MEQFLGNDQEPADPPLLVTMVGIPAVGKTTFLSQQLKNNKLPAHHYYHNPDHVMEKLSGYQRDLLEVGSETAKNKWEIPARELADNILFPEALKRRLNIVMDMGLCREKIIHMVQSCRSAGYLIHMNIIYCDLEIALKRAQSRNRHVASETITERAVFLADNIEKILTLSDTRTYFDNSDLQQPFTEVAQKDIVAKVSKYRSD